MRQLIYISLLYFVLACQGDNNKKEVAKDSNAVMTPEEEVLYDNNNFKDLKKVFRFDGKKYETDKKTIKIGDIFYTAIILPNEYYIKKNLKITHKDSIRSYIKKFENEKIVQFDFQHEQKKDLLLPEYTGVSYKKSVEYLSSLVQRDFYAITGTGDSIKPSGVLFERNFNLTPRKRILLYFKMKDSDNRLKLIYDDKIFKKGIIKFNLKKE